jgi:membrane protein YdbS with pleckstrin-like domain
MFCYRCGNQIPDNSSYCNRCGTKIQTVVENVRKPNIPVPPPRPPRRHPVIESRPVGRIIEETDEQYDETIDMEESRAQYDDIGDKIIFRINQTFYPVAVSYILSILATSLVYFIVRYLALSFYVTVVFAAVFFIPSFLKHIRLTYTFYTLTPTKLEIQTGLLSKSRRNVPLRHIQDVFVSETFKERLIGIGDIMIDTAASESTIRLDNVHEPRKYADMILEQLHRWN